MKQKGQEITREDLSVFPPYLSFFALASLFMMVSHGLAATILFFLFLPLPPAVAFGLTVGSGIFFVIFNILLIRGHLMMVKWLKSLAAVYLGVSAVSLLKSVGTSAGFSLALAASISSILALLVIQSRQYHEMASFIARRWQFYRETGRTIIEEIGRQNRKHKK